LYWSLRRFLDDGLARFEAASQHRIDTLFKSAEVHFTQQFKQNVKANTTQPKQGSPVKLLGNNG